MTPPAPTPAIVIVIDGTTGAIVSSETVGSVDQALVDVVERPAPDNTASTAFDVETSASPTPPTISERVAETAAEPQPVPIPTRVDLAVPAPPPAPTPNVAATPQASSDAS